MSKGDYRGGKGEIWGGKSGKDDCLLTKEPPFIYFLRSILSFLFDTHTHQKPNTPLFSCSYFNTVLLFLSAVKMQMPLAQAGYPPTGYPPQGGGYPPQGGMPQGYPMQQMGQMGGGGDALSRIGMAQKLCIKQKVSLLEAAGDTMGGVCPCAECCCEQPNDYEIFDQASGQKLLHVKEDSDFLWRCCCNPAHELKLNFTDVATQQQVMVAHRPFKCCQQCPAWLPFCQQESTLYMGTDHENGQPIGVTKQPCCGGLFTPTVQVMMGSEDAEPFATVEGPMCCFGGMTEMCCDQDFPISGGDGGGDGSVGMITKEKPESLGQAMAEIMTDSDLFTLSFKDPSLDQQKKIQLLSTVLLLDYMFFEQNQPWECDGTSCSITCCNMYICGALTPCKCKCESGGVCLLNFSDFFLN